MNVLTEIELMKLVDYLIYEKIEEDENFLIFTFYEVRVRGGVSSKQEKKFLELTSNKLNNMGYILYFTNQEIRYKNVEKKVQPNELLIAIKEK